MTPRTARLGRVAAVLAAGLMLSACGTLARPQALPRLTDSQALIVPDARMDAGELQALEAFDAEISAMINGTEPLAVLALSGGGANGAYGAGVLIGWSERGDRPAFNIVTGVSTGALAAPFAFLGEAWDGQLQHAYTGSATTHLLSLKNFGALVQPSLFSAQGLRVLIDEHVTPQMLAAIAQEHTKGRRLLVTTRRNGLQTHLAAIPDNVESSVLAFDQATMSDLFALGRERALTGVALRRLDQIRPALTQPFLIDAREVPERLRATSPSGAP